MWHEASDELDRLKEAGLAPPGLSKPSRAEVLLHTGREEHVLALQYDSPAHHDLLEPYVVRAYLQQNKLGEAEYLAQGWAKERRHQDAEVAFTLGQLETCKGDLESALAWYERAYQGNRSGAEYAIADTLYDLGDYREAAAVYERIARRSPYGKPEVVTRLIDCLRRIGENKQADELEPFADEVEEPPIECASSITH